MKNITQKTNTVHASPKPSSKGIALAALSLPALLLALGLSGSDSPEAEVTVAGGTDVQVTEIAATQSCQYCPPLCGDE